MAVKKSASRRTLKSATTWLEAGGEAGQGRCATSSRSRFGASTSYSEPTPAYWITRPPDVGHHCREGDQQSDGDEDALHADMLTQVPVVELAGGEYRVVGTESQEVVVTAQEVVGTAGEIGGEHHVVATVAWHSIGRTGDVHHLGDVAQLGEISLEFRVGQCDARANSAIVKCEAKFLEHRFAHDGRDLRHRCGANDVAGHAARQHQARQPEVSVDDDAHQRRLRDRAAFVVLRACATASAISRSAIPGSTPT